MLPVHINYKELVNASGSCPMYSFNRQFYFFDVLQAHQYETVSGFICEAFGYIPRTGDSINIELEKAKREKNSDYSEEESEPYDEKITHQAFKLEVSTFLR